VDLISRDCKLSTAWSAYNVRHIIIPKDLLPRICERLFGSSVFVIKLFPEGLDLVWTAWNGDAAEIGIAVTLNELGSERRQALDI